MNTSSVEIIKAKVGHKRFYPKINSFLYRVFYVKIPIVSGPVSKPRLMSIDRFNVFSIKTKDHGAMNSKVSWNNYIYKQLRSSGIYKNSVGNIYLCCFPRIFGYAFNPISYWLVTNKNGDLIAALCEVRNTFKQNHNYLLFKDKLTPIDINDNLTATKQLYVSPFNKMSGRYIFNFRFENDEFKSIINYYDSTDRHILNTYVGGKSERLTSKGILKTLVYYPLMTIGATVRIHWQALILYVKKVKPTLNEVPKSYKNKRTTRSTKTILKP